MKLAKRKSNQAWIKDFQEKATAEGLIANAVKIGIPEEDIEIVEVDETTFKQVVEAEMEADRVAREEQEALTLEEMKQVGKAVMTKLNLTKPQMKKFVMFMRQITDDGIDSII